MILPRLRMLPFFILATAILAQPGETATGKGDSGIVALTVVKTNVRLRSEPSVESTVKGQVNPGAMFVAEKWSIRDDKAKMSWYRIVGFLDKDTGSVNDRNAAGVRTPCYVSADLVKVNSYEEIKHSEEFVIKQLSLTPYGQGYGAVDSSLAAQRKMAEQKILKHVFSAVRGKSRIPVYAGPSKSSGELKGADLNGENFYNYDFYVADETKPGWLFIVDVSSRCPSGWVEAGLLEPVKEPGFFETGRLVTLNLGANVPEIMRRWGQAKSVKRQVSPSWRGNIDETVMSFDGFELTYEDHRNFEFTLTRKGAGLGGIFVGVSWCNKEYIEKTFGKKLSVEKSKSADGSERWTLGFAPDGWGFTIFLTFDKKGMVSEFRYVCADVNLS